MKLKVNMWGALAFFAFLLLLVEPSLANKFETIGSGVSGSNKIKIEYLKIASYVASAIMLIAGILSIVMRKGNAQHLNYTMWKPSSIVFFCLSLLIIGVGLYL